MSYKQALNNFLNSDDCYKAFDSATKASWANDGYSLELFDDGSYRILYNANIGNQYDSKGIVLKIPALNDSEWDDDPNIRFYDNKIEVLKELFSECLNVA